MASVLVELPSRIGSKIECKLEHIVGLAAVAGHIVVGKTADIVVHIEQIEKLRLQEQL